MKYTEQEAQMIKKTAKELKIFSVIMGVLLIGMLGIKFFILG